jgi:hypothetical protein
MIGTALPQVTAVVRGGIEPPTFRFSGGRSYQLSYLTSTGFSEEQRRLAASPR